jgi:hypothetical protein
LSSLESLISHFVDDVVRLLGEAKVADLLDLVAEAPRPIPPLEDSEPELVHAPVDDDPADAAPTRSERVPVTRLAPVRRIGRRPRRSAPTVEEITDPASLLAIAPEPPSSAPSPPPTLPTLLADPVDDVEPPPSSSQERVLVRLNSNETLARSTNAGIVIRRRKA